MGKVLKDAQVVRPRFFLLCHVENALILVVVVRENFGHSAQQIEEVDLNKACFTERLAILIECLCV